MNKERRKKLREIIGEIESVKDNLCNVLEEECDAHDNLPDGIRDSDRGADMESCIRAMEYAVDTIEDSLEAIREVV